MSVSYGVLSTYPPTQCGLASFSQALVDYLRSADDVVGVIRVVDAHETSGPGDVRHQWVRGEAGGSAAAAAALNTYDVAIIQHEYGIFGGRDGADVLAVVRALRVPTIVVLHTVLVTPTVRQRAILEELARHCVAVVTMTRTARQRLLEHYTVDPSTIRVIPHGAVDNRRFDAGDQPAGAAPVILTWGLLGEGKGIEWAIEAMAHLRDLRPTPRYRVVGQTHPRVLERHGERYRDGLVRRARQLGVDHSVQFDARYLDRAELHRMVQQADVVLLPYDSREQVTSGVLIEAVTAGKPVVSTGFPHACELLSSGAGLLVERQDPAGIAAALRRVLTEPRLAAGMAAEASRIAPELLWPAVADQYRQVAADALSPESVLAGV
ncbi:MAG: glycosyltransferase [Geodermatophilaceae bacterium]|nr:glycosyltransferase [Geodermatophilaceae bacterium]MDQ3465937.1 glycosyltransferase [Actinomycetota bacterium]